MSNLPEIGETYFYRGHEFVISDVEPYTRKYDGGQTHLIVWELRINGGDIRSQGTEEANEAIGERSEHRVPISRAVSRIRFARSASVKVVFLAGIETLLVTIDYPLTEPTSWHYTGL